MKTKLIISSFLLAVTTVCYGQWTSTYLSTGTARMGGAILGNKVYFAGGQYLAGSNWGYSDKVEIYDLKTGSWSMEYLSTERMMTAGVTCGSAVYFAGGAIINETGPVHTYYSTIDIYDTTLGFWYDENLSIKRFELSAVSNDSLVLFAGGLNVVDNVSYSVVDIFNPSTGIWSLSTLSVPRGCMGSAVLGDQAFFAGGNNSALNSFYDRVDIYHFSTGTWTTATLSQARGFIGAVTLGNKVLFAGGITANGVPSDRVDIYNGEDDTWSQASLSKPGAFDLQQTGTITGMYHKKAYFVGGNTFESGTWTTDTDTIDVYDLEDDSWSVITMPHRLVIHTVLSTDTCLVVAGGFTFTTYPYGIPQPYVEIYTDPAVGITTQKGENANFKIYPNPSSGSIHLEFPGINIVKTSEANIYNLQGQLIFTQTLLNNDRELNLQLPAGVYVLRVVAEDKVYSELITIQK
jgi:hypothetical protein